VQTLEKIPRGIELVAHGISGHGSIPLKSNGIVHLAGAVARIGDWRPDVRFNETTGTYFQDILSTDPKVRAAADDWLFENEPRHSSMLRTSVSPNIFAGGYRSNVIPSEAKATLDVRALPDEDAAKFLEQVKQVINDPAVDVHFTGQNERPAGKDARLDKRGLQGARSGRHARLQRHDAADDEHWCDRHGAASRERRAVLRHRIGD
jgi:acetylornithine deacetylase/succinyl-diaminopimelate desuccinylase-like protein